MRGMLAVGILVVVTLATPGCSCSRNDRPRVAPVQGRVLFNGEPVAGADVTFICEGAPRFSAGKTDEQGNFTLSTFGPGDGAILGVNKVTVTKSAGPGEGLGGDLPDPEAYFRAIDEMERAEEAGEPTSELPARYADPKTSDLSVTVTEGENQSDLKLVD
jgi:hypothetical protein